MIYVPTCIFLVSIYWSTVSTSTNLPMYQPTKIEDGHMYMYVSLRNYTDLKITTLPKDLQWIRRTLWDPQFREPARHCNQNHHFEGRHSLCSICIEVRNPGVNLNRANIERGILLKFPVRFHPKFVGLTYETKIRTSEPYFIELQLLECWWHLGPNLEFPQLQAHSNIWGNE
jgi:hypothetical protein